MDDETIRWYDRHARSRSRRYEDITLSEVHRYLHMWIPPDSRVLEIGCGSGRDAAFLASVGHEVTALDASAGMTDQARKLHPGISFLHAPVPLPSDHQLLQESFHGIVSLAVLMHIPNEELFDFAYQVKRLLKYQGVFICSYCIRREMPEDERLFVLRTPQEVRLLFEQLGFSLIDQRISEDAESRPVSWVLQTYRLETKAVHWGIDAVESVMNRDRKTATYKLALLRSLCDIAQHRRVHGTWLDEHRVAVPLGLAAEQWICYYWPLVESSLELPEIKTKQLSFRNQLGQLISYYRGQGGLHSFYAQYLSGKLPREAGVLAASAAGSIARAIVNGPVRYAGNRAYGLFQYSGSTSLKYCGSPEELISRLGVIIMPGDIWRELTLMGHWIQDAVILRWAELSRKITSNRVDLSRILALLLISPEQQRNAVPVRRIYEQQRELYCVWTGKRITNQLAVDHVIPFSLWHNNDLWNLLPSDSRINNAKRDKIVTRTKLDQSRELMVRYWNMLYAHDPQRFSQEAQRTLLGAGRFQENVWEQQLYHAVCESVEITALRRSLLRWPDDTG